ncbi:MAG: hypothetical protein KKH98_14320 [Spirochaetes bacterium]|nr:hypothetical protein [Spirochaetota bacterium]
MIRAVVLIVSLIFASGLYAKELKVDMEVNASFQVNTPTDSQVTSTPSRVRFFIDTSTLDLNLYFTARIIAAGGKYYFGSTGTLVPVNDVSVDQSLYVEDGKSNVILDESFFTLILSGRSRLFVGLMDPFTFDRKSGFTYSRAVKDENTGFVSPHFLKLLAYSGLDQMKYISIPAVFIVHNFSPVFSLRWGITAGLTKTHIFVRNSFPLEIELDLFRKYSRFVINFGMADADSSLVHKMSPSIGIIWDQRIYRSLLLFAQASKVFKDIKTWNTPINSFQDYFLVAKEFGDFDEHFNCGLALGSDKVYAGAGISYLKSFYKARPEKNIEFFMRFRLKEDLYLTPDNQVILNPNGVTRKNYNLMYLGALRLTYFY